VGKVVNGVFVPPPPPVAASQPSSRLINVGMRKEVYKLLDEISSRVTGCNLAWFDDTN